MGSIFVVTRQDKLSLRNWLVILSLWFLAFSWFCGPAAAESQEEWTAKLVQGAKKEGNLRFSTGMRAEEADKLIKRFNEKYPFLKVVLNRATGQKAVTKILAEARAGMHNYDVYQTSFTVFSILKEHGLLTKYISPESKYYPKMLVDPAGYWTDHYSSFFVMGYNTKLVPAREAPKNLTDLLDPKWKGKMGMDDKAFEWFAGVLRSMGEENGLRFFEKLAQQDIQFRTGKPLITQLMAAGEIRFGIALYGDMIEELKTHGAPIEWVPFDPVVLILHPLSLSAHARNPNAARLFVDFLLSREGQEMLVDMYRTSKRIDVKSKREGIKEGIKLLPYDASFMGDYEKNVKLFRQILLKTRR